MATKPIDQDTFNLISQGHAAFQLLWAGAQFDLFSKLSESGGMSQEEIANALNIQNQPARILIVGLASLGILLKDEEKYKNAPLIEKQMVKSNPDNIIDVLGWQHHIVYKGLVDFVDALKTGKNVALDRHFPGEGVNLYQRLVGLPEIENVFQNAMSSLSKQANKSLLDAIDLEGVTHLMDVGGGNATNAIAFAEKYQQLKVTVFDSKSVCEIAAENIKKHGLSDRINTHPGDLFSTPFPKGIDGILFCHMFTIWSPEKNQQILKKVYDSLPDGGKVLIFNMMGNDEDTGPISTALGSPYFLAIATGEGMLYSWKDYESWVSASGFKQMKRIDNLPLDHGFFIATK